VNEEGGEPIAVSSESNSKPTLDTETVTGSGAKPSYLQPPIQI
jgi:hypothetical protein